MKKKVKKVLVLTVGIILIILGLFGLVLPFLQGIIFLVIGFFLLSLYFPKMRLWVKKHTERYPHLLSIINKTEAWINKIVGDI